MGNGQEETTNSEEILQGVNVPYRGKIPSDGEYQSDSEELEPTVPAEDVETRNDCWTVQGDFMYRHHIEPRVRISLPKEETLPIPLKYIDVTRSTHTDLDVMQQKSIDDY